MRKLIASRAIKLKCYDCCGGSRNEAKECTTRCCPLWLFRTGHRPAEADAVKWMEEFAGMYDAEQKRVVTDEQKTAMAERFEQNRRVAKLAKDAVGFEE